MIDIKDCKVDIFSSNGLQVHIKIIHLPTRLCVSEEGAGIHALKSKLLSRLNSLVEKYNG